MHNTELRMISDRRRARRGQGDPLRRWLALFLVLASIVAAFSIFNRDVDWHSRNRLARKRGDTANHNGNYEAARAHYEAALANNPYDWETHLALADILAHKLNVPDGALTHYSFALAYSPEPSIVEGARQAITVLRLIRTGELENPYDAVDDMFRAMEGGARELFMRRLSIGLRADADAFWEAWNARGRGSISSIKIVYGHDGFYDAALELDFPDDTTMLMHFRCPLRDIWRLDLSFP
jgi:hypothetical protein